MELTREVAQEMFDYQDGQLIRKYTKGSSRQGRVVGCPNAYGYLRINYRQKEYFVHQVVFLLHHGVIPKIIDHIDGDNQNNRIENLRPATNGQNIANSKLSKRNTSGYKGVTWYAPRNKWGARLRCNNEVYFLGLFATPEEAHAAYVKAANHYFGEFARAG